VADNFRLLDYFFSCLWRIPAFRYPKSLAWKPTMGTYNPFNIFDGPIYGNSSSICDPPTAYRLGLLLLATDMELHVVDGYS
jgi:hypothetical protein